MGKMKELEGKLKELEKMKLMNKLPTPDKAVIKYKDSGWLLFIADKGTVNDTRDR